MSDRNIALAAVGWPISLIIWVVGCSFRKDERDRTHEYWREP